MKYGVLCALLLALFTCGCKTRLGDFTVISSKNIDIKKTLHRVNQNVRLRGGDSRSIIICVPMGIPSVKDAIDQAVHQMPGCVGLSDASVHYRWFYVPCIVGRFGFIVEGNPIFENTQAE